VELQVPPPKHRVLLVVLDGWGIRKEREANGILLAGTPELDKLTAQFPSSQLETSGLAVGLPEGQMGNSEVGHTNLGAGRIVYQDLVRINRAIEYKSFFQIEQLCRAMDRAKAAGRTLHLLGLLSDGGVHSQQAHLYAMVRMARDRGVAKVIVHAFTDGRDTPPRSGAGYVDEAERELRTLSTNGFSARIGSVSGRYYAMDRDNRWDRVGKAYRALARGEGHRGTSGHELVQAAYVRGENDEFILPGVVTDATGPIGTMQDGDAAIFFNFRADRAREITRALALPNFTEFDRGTPLKFADYVCMTQYDKTFPLPVAFAPDDPTDIFPELVSRAGWKQFRCAETEKYAHVTFFFNGGREAQFPGESRELIQSPRDVKTYDEKPEMSARPVTDAVLRALPENEFVLVNLANPDMVGHTGVLPAAIQAVRVVDECLGRLWRGCEAQGTAMIITADHGNIETMVDPLTGQPQTAHTLNPVPFILCHPDFRGAKLRNGILADVSPTLCDVMGLAPALKMSGRSLIAR
jgi:2,3-bisphosphoglycerate-independent phosphoglycerate mutase